MKFQFILLLFILTLTSCVERCLEKETSLASVSIEVSRTNDLFKFKFSDVTKSIVVQNIGTLNIKDAWVENAWTYKCVEGERHLVVKDYDQVVFFTDASLNMKDSLEYFLWLENGPLYGRGLNGTYTMFKYDGQDSLILYLENGNGEKLGKTTFWKKK